ncbi:MAG: hypothetical protein AAGI52_03145 [Bacteroidota bacterium]
MPTDKDPRPPCPDLGPDEECLSIAFATQDPGPVSHLNERVKVSTRWVGSSNADAINKRKGWAVGLWRYANDLEWDANQPPSGTGGAEGEAPDGGASQQRPPPNYWFQCVEIDAADDPIFERRLNFGIHDRPDLTYIADQLIAHGILQHVGRLVDLTIRVEPPNGAPHEYTPTSPLEVNAGGEWLLESPSGGRARVCPVTRALWIDEGHPAGTTVWADYTVVPPPETINDATDEIQRILNDDKVVVLPELPFQGAFYVRPHREADPARGLTESVGVTIPEGPGYPLGIRGQDERLITKKGFAYERQSVIRIMPGELGTMIEATGRDGSTPQNGAFLRNLTVHGTLDTFDLLSLTGQPPQSHHGAEFGAVENLECTGVRFTACFDDGLKIDRAKLQQPGVLRTLVTLEQGRRFRVPFETFDDPFQATGIREGQVKLDRDPIQEVRFTISIPGGTAFGGWPGDLPKDAPLTLYAANATEPQGGLAPIGFLTQEGDPYYAGPNGKVDPNVDAGGQPATPASIDDWRPLSTYVFKIGSRIYNDLAYAKAIGWLDPTTGVLCMNAGFELPDNLPVTFEALAIVSNKNARLSECEVEQNGRNGLTFGSSEGVGDDRARVHGLRVRSNGRLDAAIGLAGSFASDLQLGTTARFSEEYWEEIEADDIEIVGSRTRAMKIGQEAGHRYRLGPASYRELTIRDIDDRGLSTSGFECGPLTFEEVRVLNCANGGVFIGHAGGTDATTFWFDNPKEGDTGQPPDTTKNRPNFDAEASAPDLAVSNDAYHPILYYRDVKDPSQTGARHVFRDIRGPGADAPQAYVRIQAPGVVVDGAQHTHFVVRPSGSAPDPAWACYDRADYPAGDPPVELRNIDMATCTFDLAPGTILNGVVQGRPHSQAR